MKQRQAVVLAMVLASAGSLACGDRTAPTEPSRSFAEARPEAAALAVAGGWSGTIQFHAFEGDSQGFGCNDSAPVSVVLGQDGAILSGRFRAACAGELEMHGAVAGSGLSGSLDIVGGVSLGRISGSISSSQIAFKTTTTVEDQATHKGRQLVVSSEVELHRESSSARTTPILAGGGPSHAIAISR